VVLLTPDSFDVIIHSTSFRGARSANPESGDDALGVSKPLDSGFAGFARAPE
jgi:hypothetical protein